MTRGYTVYLQFLAVFSMVATTLALCVCGELFDHSAMAAQKEQSPQPVPPARDPLLPTGPDDVNTFYTECKECHGKQADEVKNSAFVKKYHSDQFVRLTEGMTWSQQDPHSSAFRVLSSPLGKQMATYLNYDVTRAAQCLTCHAVNKDPSSPLPTDPAESISRFTRTDEGVGCSACHGIRRAWQTKHYAEQETPDGTATIAWRTFTPQQKESFGMRDLRDPVEKAKLCVSCHVGSASEGKVVSHEMYAAGHPPLPPFELGSYMDCEPRHWGSPTSPELKFFTESGFKAYASEAVVKNHPNWTWDLYRFFPEDKEIDLARPIAAGAIASLMAEMRMIAQDATLASKAHEGGVDFARYDCFACHHDLKYPSDRQARGYPGAPGRPPLKAWIGALPEIVADHAAGLDGFAELSKGFKPRWEAVRKAALARPFGDPVELARCSSDLADWCDSFLKQLQNEAKPIYTKAEGSRLLAAIAAAATSKHWTADPEAVMHLTWAYVTLRRHSQADVPSDKLEELKKAIPTQVRTEPYKTGDDMPRTVGETFRQRLNLFRLYDPRSFVPAFQNLSGARMPPRK